MIINSVTVVPGLDCRRCGTDRGPFCSVKVGWTTRGSRRSDLADLVNGRRGPEHQHISELQLTSTLSGSRRSDFNLEPTNEFQISLGLGLKRSSIPLPALSKPAELRPPRRGARAHGPLAWSQGGVNVRGFTRIRVRHINDFAICRQCVNRCREPHSSECRLC